MSASTDGIEIRTEKRWLAEWVELLSSMRFAISLLTIISIASVIGTVLQQNQPMPNYVNQFGPFWFDVLGKLSLYTVYSAWWFLLIMGLLVLSTTLCIIRNAPKMLRDMKSWRENVREKSLLNFHHKVEWTTADDVLATAQGLSGMLTRDGYKVKLVDRDRAVLLTAKRGAGNKWGYIFAHAAIVVICVGGMMDSDLAIRLQSWIYGKTPFTGSGLISQIPEQHRLGVGNPSFRGNSMIPEGQASSTTILPRGNGVLIQDLPFSIRLDKFIIEYYSTGMPKLFASHVQVRDHATGEEKSAVIEVNKPLLFKGMAIYQSSFEDGGSKLELTAYRMDGSNSGTVVIAGEVNGTTPLKGISGHDYEVEWTGFRPFNVEDMAQNGMDVRAVNQNKGFAADFDKHIGSGAKNISGKDLRNVGPSVQYKLRDGAGQAYEYFNYMQPVETDGQYVFLAGMRDNPNDPFRYLRIPADDDFKLDQWMKLRAALHDPALRAEAARRYAARSAQGRSPEEQAGIRDQLRQSALHGLNIFAGNGKEGGYVGVSRFLEGVPAQEQERAADIFMRILHGSLWELWQVSRVRSGLPEAASTDKNAMFLQTSMNALSDATFYPAPVYLQLETFNEVKASVFQVTRSPGQNVVYLGCLLLVLGVFAMLYIRERRIWVWIRPDDNGAGTYALLAMSTQRKTLDFEKEFTSLKQRLGQTE